MASSDSSTKRISRSPNGCNAKPIYLKLRPVERDEIEGIADLLRYSIGGTSRLLILIGLQEYRRCGLDALQRANDEDYHRQHDDRI
ncbi:hypothetical protein SAMN02745148_01556 [Modicisalibacter ilicicola DSM 19980]|uniref:Uncharacterized protein n=1 Tax=Modicisalibacter ilicicola DSM 19980 TaxID=1121942 RepID=A0A1M4Y241_9GAMM|nr:hypothetical protein [Halomonas ilicicola]SHE99821.1 hypothetical protein SAMN02745148_01556 [Halomonas ilicicola DSM 19980]